MIFDRVDKGYSKGSIDPIEEIELNKKMSRKMSEVRAAIKSGECLYCKRKVSSFCNSHNIPQFCLENIGNNGELLGPNAIYGLPKMGVSIGKENPGIKESGTFNIICRECDSSIFQDYENPENYLLGKTPTQRMLTQIALKNHLKYIYKRKLEIEIAKQSLKMIRPINLQSAIMIKEFSARAHISEIDLISYKKDFEKDKNYLETGKGSGYYLFYYKLLNYVAPIAIQTPIVVSIDLDGNVVNDVFNMDPKYEPTELHLCVFPQKNTTAVFLFIENGDKKYSRFRKQFQKLDEVSKLGVINYLIFLYSEDYFMAKDIKTKVDLSALNEIANRTPVIWNTSPIRDTHVLSEQFNLSNWECIPNLLSEQYKLR